MSVKDDFLNGLKDFAKEVGTGIWGLITDFSKRAIRESLFPSSILPDIQVILNNTPKEEVPLLPLRPDTEPFLSSSLEHLSWEIVSSVRLGETSTAALYESNCLTDCACFVWVMRNSYGRSGNIPELGLSGKDTI